MKVLIAFFLACVFTVCLCAQTNYDAHILTIPELCPVVPISDGTTMTHIGRRVYYNDSSLNWPNAIVLSDGQNQVIFAPNYFEVNGKKVTAEACLLPLKTIMLNDFGAGIHLQKSTGYTQKEGAYMWRIVAGDTWLYSDGDNIFLNDSLIGKTSDDVEAKFFRGL